MPTTIANLEGGQILRIVAVIAARVLCAFGIIGVLLVIEDGHGIVGVCAGFSLMLCAGAYVHCSRYEKSVVTTMYVSAGVAAVLGLDALTAGLSAGIPIYAQAELFGFASAVLFMLPFVVRKKKEQNPEDETSEG